MEQQKDGRIIVPAEIIYNDLGVVSIWFNFTTNDDLLRKAIEGKTADESRSVVGAFAREVCNAATQMLPKSWIVLSGQFQFVDKSELANSPEEINKRAMQLLAARLVEVDDNPCQHCDRADLCRCEAADQGEEWQEPRKEVCAKSVIKYFTERAKQC